ncbi:AMP-binding protein [Mycobacterium sp. AT1]|uniref:AMP-binding protein n=1 Tax=Mycobacterium sp. AT1 TaxID=1961706 RepID=UPI0009AEBC4A|nr:AMP-binding protein [Mycobacterium sp. AT1]OPX10665.1 AMP-dependent synthetase [Mycobacterium sp. AT1]
MDQSISTRAFREARDWLLAHGGAHERAVAEFTWPSLGPTFNWAIDWFDAIARGNQRTALRIVEEDGTDAAFTFEEMAHRSDQVATWLETQGVRPGHRVLIMLGNQVELWESVLAVMKLGAIIMPTTSALGPKDLLDRIVRGGAQHVITNADQAEKFDTIDGDYGRFGVGSAPPGWKAYREAYQAPATTFESRTAPDDPMLLYFTSGTTSRPKLVLHTHQSYPLGHLSTMYFLGVQPGDVHLNISSPGWAKHAWSSFFAPWIAEATIFVYNYERFDAAKLLATIRTAGVNTFCAPPTVWRMLIQANLGDKPTGLREAVGAGEPLNPEVIAQVRQNWGLEIRDGFGQTETTALIGNTPGSVVKPGSMGRPLPGVPVEIVDPLTGRVSDEGEICLRLDPRPVNLMVGYVEDAARNDEVMAGGYYHTGDVASRDDEGFITYVGRTDDVFKSSDYKVSPFELESVLIEHPAVAEAAVVPAPDEMRLCVPKAYVSLAEGWQPDDQTARSIFAHSVANLAPYQRIRRIEFYELPKTISGKIRRVELRQRENSGVSLPDEWRDR